MTAPSALGQVLTLENGSLAGRRQTFAVVCFFKKNANPVLNILGQPHIPLNISARVLTSTNPVSFPGSFRLSRHERKRWRCDGGLTMPVTIRVKPWRNAAIGTEQRDDHNSSTNRASAGVVSIAGSRWTVRFAFRVDETAALCRQTRNGVHRQ